MNVLKRMWRTFVVARTAAALAQLSDRQLADIGIERKDIFNRANALYGA